MSNAEPAALPPEFYLRMEEKFRQMRLPAEQGQARQEQEQGEAQG